MCSASNDNSKIYYSLEDPFEHQCIEMDKATIRDLNLRDFHEWHLVSRFIKKGEKSKTIYGGYFSGDQTQKSIFVKGTANRKKSIKTLNKRHRIKRKLEKIEESIIFSSLQEALEWKKRNKQWFVLSKFIDEKEVTRYKLSPPDYKSFFEKHS